MSMLSLTKKAPDGDEGDKKDPMNTDPPAVAAAGAGAGDEQTEAAAEEKARLEAEEQKRKQEEEDKKQEEEKPLSADELRRKRLERLQGTLHSIVVPVHWLLTLVFVVV